MPLLAVLVFTGKIPAWRLGRWATIIPVKLLRAKPTAANARVTMLVNAGYDFRVAHFNYSATNVHPLSSVKIVTLPAKGTLTLDGMNVSAGDTVSLRQLNAGNLRYTPPPGESGTNFASFTFKVKDNAEADSAAVYTMTIDVRTPVAHCKHVELRRTLVRRPDGGEHCRWHLQLLWLLSWHTRRAAVQDAIQIQWRHLHDQNTLPR